MTPELESTRPTPRAFISYAWEAEVHRDWVRDLATRLRADGVDVTLDQWELHPGDQRAVFMERAVRENDYVIIICTPAYAKRSNERSGGVGYEGDIMTAEVMTEKNERKFIPVYRLGDTWSAASPTWLLGKYYVDLRDDPYPEERYQDLLTTLHGLRPTAPPIGPRPTLQRAEHRPAAQPPQTLDEPIRIIGVVVDEVTTPRNDGTRGSALYRIPFQLSRRPSHEWSDLFPHNWNRPPRWTSSHRPGIASVIGDKIYLDGTTMDEVEKCHRDTLKLAVQETNKKLAEHQDRQKAREEQERQRREEHERSVKDAAKRIDFD